MVGSTDPIRNNYDGPLLHICRVYKPKTVYILITTEMKERDRYDNRYERSILEQIDKNIEIKKIFIDLKNVHKFEVYYKPIHAYMNTIKSENPNSELLVNISSGTPQYISTIAMYISYASNKIIPIQVTTPVGAANDSPVVRKKEFDLDLEMELNIDNEDGFTDRTYVADMDYFNKLLIKSQIKKLIEKNQYSAALEMLKSNKLSNQKTNTLLNFANERLLLYGEDINEKLKILGNNIIKNIKYFPLNKINNTIPKWYKLIEYFNVIMTKSENRDYASYVLMLEPFSVKLYELILESVLKLNLGDLFEKKNINKKDIYWIDPNRMRNSVKQNIEEGFKNYFNITLSSGLKEGYLSDKVLICLIRHYSNKNGFGEFESDFIKVHDLLDKVKGLRNFVAHDLTSITKETFYNEVKISPEKLNTVIKDFIGKHLKVKGFSTNMFNIYSVLNEIIITSLDEDVIK
jgi:CRISPR type III-A/MTUBE-associated protein Csm6